MSISFIIHISRAPLLRSRSLSCGKSSGNVFSELEERARGLIEGELGTVVRDGVIGLLSGDGATDSGNAAALKW